MMGHTLKIIVVGKPSGSKRGIGVWLARPDQWDKLADCLRKAGEFGIDCETYGQPDKTSPQFRARIHCWSVGILTTSTSPRGFQRAVGRVLPAAALHHPAIAAVMADPGVRKWAHNAPHDRHAAANEGVKIRGIEDTLQWFRVACPERQDFGLKDIEQWALGYPARPLYLDLVSYSKLVDDTKRTKVTRCLCGKVPCRARSTTEWTDATGVTQLHTRQDLVIEEPRTRLVADRFTAQDFTPDAALPPIVWQPTKTKPVPPVWWNGTPIARWQAWLEYSLADAVRGIEGVSWLRNKKPNPKQYPWMRSPS